MRGKDVAILGFCGLAAATTAGVWVMSAGNGAPEAESVALAVPTPEPVVEERPRVLAPVVAQAQVVESEPVVEATPEPDAQPEAGPERADGERRQRGQWNREEIMKRFDTNGDGELSEEEREALREQMRQRRGGGDPAMRRIMMQRYDKDGDGELNEQERQAARDEFQQVRREISSRIVPQYDIDGDGELNREERQAAMPAFRAEYEKLRAVAMLDTDASGEIDEIELARALSSIGDGDETLDFNRDGTIDYEDANYAAEVATDPD